MQNEVNLLIKMKKYKDKKASDKDAFDTNIP